MHAVIKTGGKQYRVKSGDVLKIEKLEGAEGDKVVFDQVLAVGEGESLKVGTPVIEGASVKADILEQGRLRKVIVFKKRRRKGYQVKRGHRQHFTRIKITDIEG